MKIVFKGKEYTAVRQEKLFFEGESKLMGVYRIPLGELYYNIQNGRIGTYVNDFKIKNESHNLAHTLESNKEEYNNIVSKYIMEANTKKRFLETKNDILKKGQLNCGVILSDGVIIDGNRRYTALRELNKEVNDTKFAYFETIIITRDETDSAREKAIKMLEIQLQLGSDEKVDYSPIQKLVDVFNNVKSKHNKHALLTDEEYMEAAKMKKNDFYKLKLRTEIMVDFCEYFNMAENFSIVEDLKLDGPINEVSSFRIKLEKNNDIDLYETKYKQLIYTIIISSVDGDITRDLRKLFSNYESGHIDKLYEDTSVNLESVHQMIVKSTIGDELETVKKVRESNEAKNIIKDFEDTILYEEIIKKRGKSLANLNTALDKLKSIDKEEFLSMPDDHKNQIKEQLIKIRQVVLELSESLNEKK